MSDTHNAILDYADSYRQMARDPDGDGRVMCASVAVDIERNMAPLLTEAQSQLAALREELAKYKGGCVDLSSQVRELEHKMDYWEGSNKDHQQRLADAERRNAELTELLRTHTDHVATLCDVMFRFGLGMYKEPERKIYSALAQQQVVFAALNPNPEAASHDE